MKKTTPYGALLRERRVQANLSLRDVARHVGVSHVYLGEIERGISGPLKPDREPALIEAMPTVTQDELNEAREASTYQITPATTPAKYGTVTALFARRLKSDDLGDTDINKLMKLLKGEDD